MGYHAWNLGGRDFFPPKIHASTAVMGGQFCPTSAFCIVQHVRQADKIGYTAWNEGRNRPRGRLKDRHAHTAWVSDQRAPTAQCVSTYSRQLCCCCCKCASCCVVARWRVCAYQHSSTPCPLVLLLVGSLSRGDKGDRGACCMGIGCSGKCSVLLLTVHGGEMLAELGICGSLVERLLPRAGWLSK